MRIIGVIQAYMEADRIAGAVESLFVPGCDDVFVLDGAWRDAAGRTFAGGPAASTDGTLELAAAAGAHVAMFDTPGSNDALKQTALMQRCGAEDGDYVIRIDADERLQVTAGQLHTKGTHALVWLHNHGENDLPDVRSTWPRGDNADHPIPLLRMFKWRPDLVCESPGRWRTSDGPIEPYIVGALRRHFEQHDVPDDDLLKCAYRALRDEEHRLDPAHLAALPILDGVWIDHYRDGRNADAKRVYYETAAALA